VWGEALPDGPVVLLVEDDADLRELTMLMLRRRGFAVLVVNDSPSALMVSRTFGGEIHVLLTDLRLPGVSGRELSRAVSDLYPTIETVYISGLSEEDAVREGLVKPRSTFIVKPYTAEDLVARIWTALENNVHWNAVRGG
jgi:DNA-binding response OmpR family regulator